MQVEGFINCCSTLDPGFELGIVGEYLLGYFFRKAPRFIQKVSSGVSLRQQHLGSLPRKSLLTTRSGGKIFVYPKLVTFWRFCQFVPSTGPKNAPEPDITRPL